MSTVGNSRRFGWRALLAAAAVGLTTFLPAAAVAPPASASNCADVLFLGARGSGEKYRDQWEGFGREVAKVRAGLSEYTSQVATVEEAPVRYVAQDAYTLLPSKWELNAFLHKRWVIAAGDYYITRYKPFADSISGGVYWAHGKLVDNAKSCPHQQIVLAGYSQGAMVMHRLLQRLVHENRTRILSRIVGVALVADGDRVKNSATALRGSAPPNAQGVHSGLTVGERDIVKVVRDKTINLCNDNDLVCDFNLGSVTHPFRGIRIHETYTEFQLKAVGRRVGRWVSIAKQNSYPPSMVCDSSDFYLGVPYSFTYEIGDHRAGTWSVDSTNGTGLPDGITLNTATGVMSGTPSGPDWMVDGMVIATIRFTDTNGQTAACGAPGTLRSAPPSSGG